MTAAIVITGASSGIGAAFARRLAARGDDLVLVARRRAALESLAVELSEAHGVRVAVLDADLADPAAVRELPTRITAEGISARGLINSAGFGTAGPLAEEDPLRIADEIQVNVAALTVLTRLLLPDLISARGMLIQLSSTAAHQPMPGMAVYGATKAFVTSLTEAIWRETRGTGLSVLALCPGPTETEFFEAAGSEVFKIGRVGSAEDVVDAALARLDRPGHGPVLTVGGLNRVQEMAARLAPRRLRLAVAARLTGSGS